MQYVKSLRDGAGLNVPASARAEDFAREFVQLQQQQQELQVKESTGNLECLWGEAAKEQFGKDLTLHAQTELSLNCWLKW